MNFLALLQLFASIMPMIHSTITALEPAFPHASQGAAKADAVVQQAGAIITAAAAAAGPAAPPDAHLAAVQAALPALVGTVITLKAGYDAVTAAPSASAPAADPNAGAAAAQAVATAQEVNSALA